MNAYRNNNDVRAVWRCQGKMCEAMMLSLTFFVTFLWQDKKVNKIIYSWKSFKCFLRYSYYLWFIIAITSCSKFDEFGDINQNPAVTTKPITSALLTNTIANLAYETWDATITGSAGLTTVCGFYCQYFSEISYTELSTYAKPNINWDRYYAGGLYDLQLIINYNTDAATAAGATAYGSNSNQIAVARILKVYLYSLLTDCYGDLPYFNALRGDFGINPFDEQEDIYKDLFKELSEATSQFDGGNPPLGDILFNGDITKWKKFANSLHALLALRLSETDPELGRLEFNAALTAEGGVLESGENAEIVYLGSGQNNPVYVYYQPAVLRIGVSATMTNWLVANNDNRITAYASSSKGVPYGVTKTEADNFINANADWAKVLQGSATSATAPFPVLTCAEIFLARAEAAQRGWTNELADSMYRKGINESWQYWKVYNDSAFNSYMQQNNIALAGNADDLQKICEQQWTAHYPNGPRGFSMWRRTGWPALIPGPASLSAAIPRRIPYGGNTYGTNPNNTNEAAERYSVNGEQDSQWGRVWWDEE